MRIIIFLTLCVLAISAKTIQNSKPRIFENEVQEMLECIRGVLKTGIEEVGLPSFEPLNIQHILVNVSDFNLEDASGQVDVNNAVITGITNWQLEDLKIKANIIGGLGASITGKLALPNFVIDTGYIAELSISGIHIFGDGTIYIDLSTLKFDIDVDISLTRINLKKLRLLPSLEDIDFKITGLLNDEEHSALASQIVNEIAVDWINQKSEDFADVIESFVQGLINGSNLKEGNINIEDIINAILEKCPLPFK